MVRDKKNCKDHISSSSSAVMSGPGVDDVVALSLSCCTRLDDDVLVGCMIKPFLQASEITGSWSTWPFAAIKFASHNQVFKL